MTMKSAERRLGHYQLLLLLGHGSFADVYLGEHIHLKSVAAIKMLYTRLLKEQRENFLNEARVLAQLSHPHIIRILDFGIEEDVPYLVMDYASEGSLSQRHARNTLVPLKTVVDYVRQIGDGLQYAHDKKLIHRDLKPDNILIGQNGDLLLGDFGVALIAQSTYSQDLRRSFAGTVFYMAPEQLQGKPVFASDQYALGIMTYEWLCGTYPFQGTMVELYSQHSAVPPASLREYVPSLSQEVDQVVLRALAKDPNQRFASVKEFARALEQAYLSSRTTDGAYPILTPQPDPSMAASAQEPAESSRQKPPEASLIASSQVTQPDAVMAVSLREPSEDSLIASSQTPAAAYMRAPALSTAPPPPTTPAPWIVGAIGSLRVKLSLEKKFLLPGLALLILLGGSGISVYAFSQQNHKLAVVGTPASSSTGNAHGVVTQSPLKNAGSTPTKASSAKPTPIISSASLTAQPTQAPNSTIPPTAAPKATATSVPVPAPAPTAAPTPVPVCPATIQDGSTGSLVKTLQSTLNARYSAGSFPNSPHNFSPPLAVDGDFGALTKAAVEDYQTAKGIIVDGIVGPQTWHSLGYC